MRPFDLLTDAADLVLGRCCQVCGAIGPEACPTCLARLRVGPRSVPLTVGSAAPRAAVVATEYADEVGAAAVDYLRVAGHLVFGYLFARMAQVALREIAAGNTDPFYGAKLQTARFYFAKLFPETATLMRTARAGAKVLMDTELALA